MGRIMLLGLLGCITACAAGRAEQGSARNGAESPAFAASAVAVMQAYDLESRFQEAVDVGRFAIDRARLLKDVAGEARLTAELGRVLTRQLRHEPALRAADVLDVLQRARKLAEDSGDRSAQAAALDAEGMFLYWDKVSAGKGEWAPVVSLFERAHALASEAGDARGVSETLFHLGLTRQFGGDAAAARGFFERSLKHARESADALMQSYALRHLADLVEKDGDLDTALAYHRECLRLREQVGFRTGQVFALLAVSHVLTVREPRSEEALDAARRALRLAEDAKDVASLREAQAGLGHVYVRRGDAASALSHLEQALTNAEAHQDWFTVVDVQLGLARAHALRGEKPRVEEWVRRAWALATERGLSAIFEDVRQLGREHGIALR